MNNKNYRSLLIIASTFLATITAYRHIPSLMPGEGSKLTEATQHSVASIDYQSFESRLSKLETSLDRTAEIQNRMVELFEEVQSNFRPTDNRQHRVRVHGKLDTGLFEPKERFPTPDQGPNSLDTRLQRLIAEGLAPERAIYILELEKRFWRAQSRHVAELHRRRDGAISEVPGQGDRPQVFDLNKANLQFRELLNRELSASEVASYLVATKGEIEFQITGINRGSVAESVGLQPGDRILSYNGEPVLDPLNMRTLMEKVPAGEYVEIEIRRPGSETSEKVYVPSAPLCIEVMTLSPPSNSTEDKQ